MVLTPHPGEAARLLGREVPRDAAGREDAAREISRRARAICCLKGHRTVVVDGDRVYVNETGNPGMATAGAGDVLAGILGAYLAACETRIDPSFTPFDAVVGAQMGQHARIELAQEIELAPLQLAGRFHPLQIGHRRLRIAKNRALVDGRQKSAVKIVGTASRNHAVAKHDVTWQLLILAAEAIGHP